MINNIVFDLGNVLLSFNPSGYLDKSGYTTGHKNIIINDIFRSREWELIDNGDITTGDAIDKISSRSSLNRKEIASLFNLRIKILYPITRNTKLLHSLKERGFKLYFLSNFPDDIFDEVHNKYEFFKFFDGGIISSRVKVSKPDRKIFDILLEKYSLKAEECLFIDDNELNVKTADRIGMTGIFVLASDNISELIENKLCQISEL
jgi:epoxide hydrolase-like predicted phosphatase